MSTARAALSDHEQLVGGAEAAHGGVWSMGGGGAVVTPGVLRSSPHLLPII
jgi:hypothetical protein